MLLAVITAVAACGGDATTVAPMGMVVPIPGGPEGIVVGRSGTAAIAVRNPPGVALVDSATGVVRQTVQINGAARHLSLAGVDGQCWSRWSHPTSWPK
ncbi:hypothetical protein [Mycolicibacterium gadium]|uniref:hypothetical protein n=1 Tax=Mycolicibacterium gadium TaxID=1794 RepID=UPI0015D3382A|nr:hypothetical protein [Mycolicibacterium gadium]